MIKGEREGGGVHLAQSMLVLSDSCQGKSRGGGAVTGLPLTHAHGQIRGCVCVSSVLVTGRKKIGQMNATHTNAHWCHPGLEINRAPNFELHTLFFLSCGCQTFTLERSCMPP